MAVLARSVPWTQQPQIACGVDWSNPLARGLVFAVNPAVGALNIARFRPVSAAAGYTRSIDPGGKLAYSSGYFDTGVSQPASNGLTMFSLWSARPGQYLAADNYAFLLSTRTSGNAGWSWGRYQAIGGGSLGNLTKQVFTANGIADYFEANSTIPSLASTPVACRYSPTTGLASFFSFGAKSSPDVTVSAPSAGTSMVYRAQGPFASPSAQWLDLDALTLLWDRPLSDTEIASVSANPWQLFAPMRRFIPIGATGTVYRPGTDVAVSGWTFTNAASFSGAVGELTYDPSSYATSPDLTSPATAALDIAMPAGSYTVSVAGQRNASQGQVRLVYLDASNASVGATSWQALSGSEATYNLPVTTTGTATQVRLELQP